MIYHNIQIISAVLFCFLGVYMFNFLLSTIVIYVRYLVETLIISPVLGTIDQACGSLIPVEWSSPGFRVYVTQHMEWSRVI